MNSINDVTTLQRGRYRADFNGQDLGILLAPPEISADYETVSLAVCDETLPSGYGEIGNKPQLFGMVRLSSGAVSEVLRLLADSAWQSGKLRLQPEFPGTGAALDFPAAQLLPKWEFEPERNGNHMVRIYLRLQADSAGKLFYIA